MALESAEKACSKCGTSHPLENFPPTRHRPDGRSPWCRPCHRAATAEWYADPANRERANATRRLREARNKRPTPTLEALAERVARLETSVNQQRSTT